MLAALTRKWLSVRSTCLRGSLAFLLQIDYICFRENGRRIRPVMKQGAGPFRSGWRSLHKELFDNPNTRAGRAIGVSEDRKTKPDSLNYFRGYRESTLQIYLV